MTLTTVLFQAGQSAGWKLARYGAVRMLKLGLRLYQYGLIPRERMLTIMAAAGLLHKHARERLDDPGRSVHRSRRLRHFRRRI